MVDPPAPAGDLLADVTAFTTLDACMKQRSQLDPLLADALASVGYGTFVRDACRVLEAAKTHDRTRCQLIDASALRLRCESVAAVFARDADACPMATGVSADGRDPVCVAFALRRGALCRGADARARVGCEAATAADEKPCAALPSVEARGVCARDVNRWRALLRLNEAQTSQPIKSPSGLLEVHGADGRAEPPKSNFDLSAALSRGVVVVKRADRWQLQIGVPDPLGAPRAASPSSSGKLAFRLEFGPEASAPRRLGDLSVSIPGAAALACESVRCEVTVTEFHIDASRGGEVSVALEGRVGVSPQAFSLRAALKTFVRDVVSEIGAPSP